MPAMETSRLARRFSAVIAGRGLLVRECRDSTIQLERFKARKAVSVARQSGISVKRLEDKSSECRLFDSGARLDPVMEVRELSARLRCLKNLHLEAGSIPDVSKLDEIPLRELLLEFELPDPERLMLLAGLDRT